MGVCACIHTNTHTHTLYQLEPGHICGRITITQCLWSSGCLRDWFSFQVSVDGKIKDLFPGGLLSGDIIGCPLVQLMERNLRPEVEWLLKLHLEWVMYIYKPIHENCPSRTFPQEWLPEASESRCFFCFSFWCAVDDGCNGVGAKEAGWRCGVTSLVWLIVWLGSPRVFKKIFFFFLLVSRPQLGGPHLWS